MDWRSEQVLNSVFFWYFLVQAFHIGFLLATFCGLLHPHKFIPRNAPEELHGSRRSMHSFAASNGSPVWFVDNQCRSWQSSTEAPSHCPNLCCRGPRDAVLVQGVPWPDAFAKLTSDFKMQGHEATHGHVMIFWEVSHTCNKSRMSRRMWHFLAWSRTGPWERIL